MNGWKFVDEWLEDFKPVNESGSGEPGSRSGEREETGVPVLNIQEQAFGRYGEKIAHTCPKGNVI
jgi:hypothetical protein